MNNSISNLRFNLKTKNFSVKLHILPSTSVTRALMLMSLHLITLSIVPVHLMISGSFSSNITTRKCENVKSVVLPRISMNCFRKNENCSLMVIVFHKKQRIPMFTNNIHAFYFRSLNKRICLWPDNTSIMKSNKVCR